MTAGNFYSSADGEIVVQFFSQCSWARGERGAAPPSLRDNWRGWDRPFPSDPNRTEVMYGRDKGYFPNIWIVRKYFIHC